MSKPHILLISGSAAAGSHSLANVHYAQRLLEQGGAYTTIWDVQSLPLPIHDPAEHHRLLQAAQPEVRELASLAAMSDAFVWSTPVYHNTFSGALKNALDNLSIEQVAHKPVLLISNGGGRFGSMPCEHLRSVARGLLAVAVPCQIVTLGEDFQPVDGGFELSSASIQERFGRACKELLAYTLALRQVREHLLMPG